jgi:hypothetical protein
MIDMLWSVQWIWTKSHLYKLKKWQCLWWLECLMLTFRLVYCYTFPFLSFFLFIYMTNLWSSIDEFKEQAYNRWILCSRWAIVIIIHWNCPMSLIAPIGTWKERDIQQKVTASLWRFLSSDDYVKQETENGRKKSSTMIIASHPCMCVSDARIMYLKYTFTFTFPFLSSSCRWTSWIFLYQIECLCLDL